MDSCGQPWTRVLASRGHLDESVMDISDPYICQKMSKYDTPKKQNNLKWSEINPFWLKLTGNGAKSIEEAIGILPGLIFPHIQFTNPQNHRFGAHMGAPH